MAAHHDFVALDEALRVRSTENRTTGEKSAAITYKGCETGSDFHEQAGTGDNGR